MENAHPRRVDIELSESHLRGPAPSNFSLRVFNADLVRHDEPIIQLENSMRRIDRFLENPFVYLAWQYPFAAQKLRPILRLESYKKAKRVFDIGCGPGINTPHFAGKEYLGVDINPQYVDYAKKRHKRSFVVANASTFVPAEDEKFDLIAMNGLLHHINDEGVMKLLSNVKFYLYFRGRVTPG